MAEKSRGEELKEKLFDEKRMAGKKFLKKRKRKYLIIAITIWIF